MVDDIHIGYAGWANCNYVACWNLDGTSFTSKFCGLKGVVGICGGWAVNVASSDLDPKFCSNILVALRLLL